MSSAPFQEELFTHPTAISGTVFVNDRAAEAYAMVLLFESGYADQNDIARGFGYSVRSLRRYQERLKAGGLSALARPRGRPSGHKKTLERDQTILRLKTKGMSNRWVAGRLGLSETAVRKSLLRLGWKSDSAPDAQPALPFLPEAASQTKGATVRVNKVSEIPSLAAGQPPRKTAPFQIDSAAKSLDANPLDRSMDRLLAAMGLLDDALPLFAPTRSLPRAGVLLALLRIPRPEALKEYPPGELGRIVGLDRMPEVKTLRRKLARLASLQGSYRLGREMARQRIAERGKVLGFLYIDGHVRAYHGKHTISKVYVTRMHLAAPATTDYWVNDQRGDPLFVVTADANPAMTRMLVPVLSEVRELLGPRRHSTVVFDRAGWSPKLFRDLLAMSFDVLTYRKGRTPHISEKRFAWHKASLDGRQVRYLLHDQPVRFLKGKLRLRQVTRLTRTGHQTPIVTSRWDLRAIVVAHRMFERWRQENFFKYLNLCARRLSGQPRRPPPFRPQPSSQSRRERDSHGSDPS